MPDRDFAELLALLTCRSTDVLSAGGGGKPVLTQHDVAALMAGLAFEESELLRVKYCGEPRHKLWSWWFRELMRKGWSGKDGRLERLSLVTLDECINPRVCGGCQGVKGSIIDKRWVECEYCHGVGHTKLSERGIATKLGFSSRLNEPWISRLEECRAWLYRIEYAALEKASRN